MEKYQWFVKTNYFHVRDAVGFENFMKSVVVEDGEIELLFNTDGNGFPLFGFSTKGLITGLSAIEDDETMEPDDFGDPYEEFLVGLQELVDEDDAIIMMEVGMDGDGGLSASATIITADDTDYLDLQELASNTAIEMLSLPVQLRR